MKIGDFPVLRVEKPEIVTINGGMDFKAPGMSQLNNEKGLFPRDRFRGRGRLRETSPKDRFIPVHIHLGAYPGRAFWSKVINSFTPLAQDAAHSSCNPTGGYGGPFLNGQNSPKWPLFYE